jgi:hypothetical protein
LLAIIKCILSIKPSFPNIALGEASGFLSRLRMSDKIAGNRISEDKQSETELLQKSPGFIFSIV